MRKFLFFFFFFLFSLSSFSSAVSISSLPLEQRTLVFTPGKTFEFNLKVSGAPEISVLAMGDMSEYVVIDDPFPGGGERTITVKFTHPDAMGPGKYKTYIAAVEGSGNEGGNVAAKAMVRTGIITRVLGPEKLIKAKLSIEDVNVGGTSQGKIYVESWTLSDIIRVFAEIEIFDPAGESIGVFETDRRSLPATNAVQLEFEIPTKDFVQGIYAAKGVVYFDEKKEGVSSSFRIGQMAVNLVNYSREYKKGVINPVELFIASEWKGTIPDVYAVVDVAGRKLQTPELNVGSFSKAKLETFWDAGKLELGDYPAKIEIFYGNTSTKEEAVFTVIEAPIEEEENSSSWFSSPIGIAYILVIILVLINVYFLFFRKKRGGGHNEE